MPIFFCPNSVADDARWISCYYAPGRYIFSYHTSRTDYHVITDMNATHYKRIHTNETTATYHGIFLHRSCEVMRKYYSTRSHIAFLSYINSTRICLIQTPPKEILAVG